VVEPVRQFNWPIDTHDEEANLTREWLVSNGLGGYASGTVSGVVTRRYHGMLIAALPAPFGRIVMLSHVAEQLRFPDGRRIEVGGRERVPNATGPKGSAYLVSFRLEAGLPVWRFDIEGILIHGAQGVRSLAVLLVARAGGRLQPLDRLASSPSQ